MNYSTPEEVEACWGKCTAHPKPKPPKPFLVERVSPIISAKGEQIIVAEELDEALTEADMPEEATEYPELEKPKRKRKSEPDATGTP